MDLVSVILLLIISAVVGVFIRKGWNPPISMEYLTANTNTKDRLRNDYRDIYFISNVFFGLTMISIFMLLMVIFLSIKVFRFISYLTIGCLFVFVFL